MTVRSATTVSATVELQGHLFDSLTLSKVMDGIQELGGNFRINHMRMGDLKNDTSFVSIKIFGEDQKHLDKILNYLTPYGAKTAGDGDALLDVVATDGELPDHTLKIYLPKEVRVKGQWLEVDDEKGDWVIAITGNKTELKQAKTVKAGEQLVVNAQGIRW